MVSYHLDLRHISVGMDLSSLHRNSDRPAFYSGWICVSDCCLPLKGTAHRAVKDKDALKPAEVNTFVSSDLWRLQGLAGDFPLALGEPEFHVPSARGHLSGNDARKNLTDSQETSQWIAGEACTIKILEALLGSLLDNKYSIFFNWFDVGDRSQKLWFYMLSMSGLLRKYGVPSKFVASDLRRSCQVSCGCKHHSILRFCGKGLHQAWNSNLLCHGCPRLSHPHGAYSGKCFAWGKGDKM